MGLAVGIVGVWFWLLVEARNNPTSRELFDTIQPIALAAAGFILAEPVIRDRRDRRRRLEDEDRAERRSDARRRTADEDEPEDEDDDYRPGGHR